MTFTSEDSILRYSIEGISKNGFSSFEKRFFPVFVRQEVVFNILETVYNGFLRGIDTEKEVSGAIVEQEVKPCQLT